MIVCSPAIFDSVLHQVEKLPRFLYFEKPVEGELYEPAVQDGPQILKYWQAIYQKVASIGVALLSLAFVDDSAPLRLLSEVLVQTKLTHATSSVRFIGPHFNVRFEFLNLAHNVEPIFVFITFCFNF